MIRREKLCKAFSCLVTRKGDVIWETGIDSHDKLYEKNKIKYDLRDDIDVISKPLQLEFARIEIVPDNTEKYSYLYPELEWKYKIDENITPRWLNNSYEKKCWNEFNKWKTQVYSSFNYLEARNPINPFKIEPPQITEKHIKLLKKWDSVRASIGDSVGASIGDSVGASIGDSVGASVRASVGASIGDSVWASIWDSTYTYTGSMFPNIKELNNNEGYIFQSSVDLWRQGIVPSYDGTTWRLHTRNGVVYEATQKQLREYKK